MDEIADGLDVCLRDMMKNGMRVLTKDGQAVVVDPSPALLNVARQRLRDCGMTKVVQKDDALSELAAELAKQGKIHDLKPIQELDSIVDEAANA